MHAFQNKLFYKIKNSILYSIKSEYNLDFLEFRLWIGLWTAFILFVFVVFNLSFLVKFITRFTEDCFATLVAIVFIIDSLKSTLSLKNSDYFKKLNRNSTQIINISVPSIDLQIKSAKQDSVFYFSLLLFFLTFTICGALKSFRNKPYLPNRVI